MTRLIANMSEERLSDLIALGEDFTTEFKRAMPSDLGREICAFANATGGVILLGVADNGAVCGFAGHNRLKFEVQSIARSAEPSITVEVESVGEVLWRTLSPGIRQGYQDGVEKALPGLGSRRCSFWHLRRPLGKAV